MHVVIFEFEPDPARQSDYFDLAAELRPLLAQIDGFISIERFQSLSDPAKMLSISFWRDEAALQEWRALDQHRTAQRAGRECIFRSYRLRVAEVVRDYSLTERDQAPADSRKALDGR